MSKLTMNFLSRLRTTRQRRHGDAQETYWNAAATLAAGKEPKSRDAVAEALEKLNRTEEDLGRDADLLAQLDGVQQHAQRRDAAKARLAEAVKAKGVADAKARDLERQARDIRANADAAVGEARTEVDAATKASGRVTQLRMELARRGHPAHVAVIEQAATQRAIEAKQNDLAAIERELAEAEAAAATFDGVGGGGFEDAVTARARRARQEVLRLRDLRDRMVREIAELRGGVIDEGEDVSDQLLAEEAMQ